MNKTKQQVIERSGILKLEAYLDQLELEARQLKLLLNNFTNPPNRIDTDKPYKDDWNVRWAKEIKPEHDYTKRVEFIPRHDPYWETR